jgi:hypothetical protein
MSSGLEVADVFRRYGDAYRRAHDGHLSRVERRVMSAIELCRTAVLGGHTETCADCDLVRCAYDSCRNRHCPKCQGQTRAEWLAARQAELLPVPYFHVVFTLPAAVAEIAYQNKTTVYTILFRTAAETLRTIAADPKHLGACGSEVIDFTGNGGFGVGFLAIWDFVDLCDGVVGHRRGGTRWRCHETIVSKICCGRRWRRSSTSAIRWCGWHTRSIGSFSTGALPASARTVPVSRRCRRDWWPGCSS